MGFISLRTLLNSSNIKTKIYHKELKLILFLHRPHLKHSEQIKLILGKN